MAKQWYPKKNKYGNKKVTVDGVTYDSVGEHQRFCFLKLFERAGAIKDLQYHKEFELIPPVRKEVHCKMKNGTTYTRVTNEPRVYEADFTYTIVATGEEVVEDFKGVETELFLFKADLFYHLYKKHIRIVKHINEDIY